MGVGSVGNNREFSFLVFFVLGQWLLRSLPALLIISENILLGNQAIVRCNESQEREDREMDLWS
jgi:hypothetical protein